MATKRVLSDNPALHLIQTTRGMPSRIAEQLGITRTAVWMWKRVPAQHAVAVAEMLEMPVHVVCPEVFPAPQKARASLKTQPQPETDSVKER